MISVQIPQQVCCNVLSGPIQGTKHRQYDLRNCSGKLTLPKPRTDQNYRNVVIIYSGALLWNSTFENNIEIKLKEKLKKT